MKIYRNFLSNWRNILGLIFAFAFFSISISAPFLSPQTKDDPGPFKQIGDRTDFVPHPPSKKAILGTAPQQFDIFHTLVWGTRDALQFGLLVVFVSMFFGVFYGAIAGSAGGIINSTMMRISDAFLSFPIIAGVVFIQQLVSSTIVAVTKDLTIQQYLAGRAFEINSTPFTEFFAKVDPLIVAMILFSWMSYARITNTRVITLKENEFVQASRALGGRNIWIIRKHLIPNSIAPAIVIASRDIGNVVIMQATLTFLEMGGNSPWGNMLAMGRDWIIGPGGSVFEYWWVYIPVTVTVILFGITWNLLGDGINEIMNPSYVRASSNNTKQQEN